MTWHTLYSRYASPTSREAGNEGLQALVIDGMLAAAHTMDGLDDETIGQRLDLLISEMRQEGISTPLVNFGQFLKFVAPRHHMFSHLYQKVALAEWSRKMAGSDNQGKRKESDNDYVPSLRVRVWVGGGNGRGAGGERMTIDEALAVLSPASDDTRDAVFKNNMQSKWLARCSRIAIDTTAIILKGGSLASLPTVISAKAATDTSQKVPLLDGADIAHAQRQGFKISQEGSATRFVAPTIIGGSVLLISDRAASSGVLRWRFKANKNVFDIAVIMDGTKDTDELRVGLASSAIGAPASGANVASVAALARAGCTLAEAPMTGKWVDVVCDIVRQTVVFTIEGSSPIEQSLAKLSLSRGVSSAPASAPAFGASAPAFRASAPAFGSSAPAFGASAPAFGASASAPAFGSAAAFGASAPEFGATAPAFKSSASALTYGSTPASGASAPAFGASAPPFGSAPAFGASAPAFAASEKGNEGPNTPRQFRLAMRTWNATGS
jgi:hypothetical protein